MRAGLPILRLGCLLLAGGLVLRAPAQTAAPATDPPALKNLRDDLFTRVLSGSRQLSVQYATALVKLEDSLAATGDYEDALAARKRRLALEAIYAADTSLKTTMMEGTTLSLAEARLTGSVVLLGGALTNWRTAQSAAEWSPAKVAPGRYQVEITYTLTEAPFDVTAGTTISRLKAVDRAQFRLADASPLAPSASAITLDLTKTAEDAPPSTSVAVGTITIARANVSLRLTPAQAYPANLIQIKSLRLLPESSTLPTQGSSPTPISQATDIEALRQIFLRNLHAAREPVIASHMAQIDTLLAQPASTGNVDYFVDIKAEQKRALRLREATKRAVNWRLEGLSTGGLDGFEDVSSARYVDDPGNTGDRFKVDHEGGTHFIQLLWVRCPPATADGVPLGPAAKFFGTSAEDALTVGRLAAEFTRGYLAGKSLRLMLRPAAAKDGVIPAVVFLEGGGLYQSMLLEHGFAALVAPASGVKRPIAESALVKSLADREKAARDARPPAGIWALREINTGGQGR